jgi:hypothetical protein
MTNNDNYWYRYCTCTNLGLPFQALGKKFSAAEIYSFYLSRRIVAVKTRRKTSSSGERISQLIHLLCCCHLLSPLSIKNLETSLANNGHKKSKTTIGKPKNFKIRSTGEVDKPNQFHKEGRGAGNLHRASEEGTTSKPIEHNRHTKKSENNNSI